MTQDGLIIVRCIFSNFWKLMTDWHIPGTNVTPAMWAIFIVFAVFVFKFVIPNILSIGLSDHGGK